MPGAPLPLIARDRLLPLKPASNQQRHPSFAWLGRLTRCVVRDVGERDCRGETCNEHPRPK